MQRAGSSRIARRGGDPRRRGYRESIGLGVTLANKRLRKAEGSVLGVVVRAAIESIVEAERRAAPGLS